MTTSMRAIVIREQGGPEVLVLQERPRPSPGREELLIEVAASGVNRADLLQRRGLYPAPAGSPPDIPGLEYAGTVVEAGAGCRLFAPGDRVMGVLGGGGYADHVVVHERTAVSVPQGMPLVEAAAIPEVFMTAYDALFARLELSAGESLLVHAVGSGVGTAAVQLAAWAGAAPVIGTSRTAAKLATARALGLDAGVQAGEGWPALVQEATGGRGVDCVLDLVGGGYLGGNLEAMAAGGRQVVVGLTAGTRAQLDLGLLLKKRLRLTGTTLRARPLEEKARLARLVETRLLPAFAAGKLRPVVDRSFAAAEAAAAHEHMEANANFGKILLTWE